MKTLTVKNLTVTNLQPVVGNGYLYNATKPRTNVTSICELQK